MLISGLHTCVHTSACTSAHTHTLVNMHACIPNTYTHAKIFICLLKVQEYRIGQCCDNSNLSDLQIPKFQHHYLL